MSKNGGALLWNGYSSGVLTISDCVFENNWALSLIEVET